jgi:hypothetical protein
MKIVRMNMRSSSNWSRGEPDDLAILANRFSFVNLAERDLVPELDGFVDLQSDTVQAQHESARYRPRSDRYVIVAAQ